MFIRSYHFNQISNISIANLWVKGGSNQDRSGLKGINNILALLIARGCSNLSNFELSEIIESNGADLICETYEDGIFISIKSVKENFNKVFPIIRMIIEKPNLLEKEFLKCQTNALLTITKSRENPFNKVFENWRKIVYEKHPYAFDPNGYEDDIKNICYDDILNEYKNFISREKILLTNHKQISSIDLNSQIIYNPQDKVNIEKQNFNVVENILLDRFAVSYKNTKQVILMIGNKTCPYFHEDYLVLKLLEAHLSYGMSSVLFKIFREDNGLTYDSGVYYPERMEESPFVIYLSVSEKNSQKAFILLMKLIKSISTYSLTDKEMKMAKIKLNSSLLHSNQTLEERLYNKIRFLKCRMDINSEKNFTNRISQIHADDIKSVVAKYFSKNFISVSGNRDACNRIRNCWLQNS